MPGLWADTECKREDLSEEFWTVTKPHRQHFERLGFVECGFLKAKETLVPGVRDSGGITYLDRTRCQFGQLIYNRYLPRSAGTEISWIVIAFTAAFEHGSLACTNSKKSFDPPDENKVIRVESHDVGFIYQQFLDHLRQRTEAPRSFPDLESLRQWFDARQVKAFEGRVRRGLFIPMTAAEVAAAQAGLRLDNHGKASSLPRLNFRWGIWLVIILAVGALQFVRNRNLDSAVRPGKTDEIEYRGQNFKMRKAYATYEDYKDDPNNLNTNELERIEEAMVSAKVPASFKNREEFSHFLFFDLKFPGYGLGSVGASAQTDDGSKLHVESVEIPQRDKERVIVARESAGRLELVDDFIQAATTNEIARAKLENNRLFYYDRNDRVIREKSIGNP
ncbi:MAG: hypothetical protein QOJ40_2051 [Verrucomicrobiota bacterium]